MTVQIYKHTDIDAPQLSSNRATLNQVLKACLVTGYGDKPAAGWQLVYDSQADNFASTEHRICLRSNDLSSTRTYFEFNATFSSTNIVRSEVSAFDAWTADNQGLGLINHGARAGFNGNSLTAMYMTYQHGLRYPVNQIKWMVIADGKGFYLLLGVNNTQNAYTIGYFGDYISFNPAQPQVVIAAFNAGGGYDMGGFASASGSNLSAQGRICLADKKLAALTSLFTPLYGFGNRYANSTWLQNPSYQVDMGTSMVFSRPLLVQYANNNMTLIGYLPGLLDCPAQSRGQPIDDCWQHFVDGDTVLEMPIHACGTNFINITDWDR